MAAVVKLVSPEGVLHIMPIERKPKKAFCEAHGLRVDYLNLHLAGDERYNEHGGWQKLDKVKWLQNRSGAIVIVVGKPKKFFDKREVACERAGLERGAMDFSLRQFERLLDADDSSVEELPGGWRVVEQPPLVQQLECSSVCSTCLCATADLYQLLNPCECDELTLLRQQLAVSQQQLAQVEKERDGLRTQCEAHVKARKVIGQAARRRKTLIAELKGRMMKLTKASHLQFEKLVSTHAPPAARHLKHLFDSQLRALKSKSLRTYWHEEILDWCAKIFRKDRGAYELMWSGQMLLLPHPDTIRKRCAAQYARPGHDDDRYETIRSEMADLFEIDRNVAVKFDEVNTRADLVWKERGGEFELFGLADVIPGARMYSSETKTPMLSDKMATHALVFQVRPSWLPPFALYHLTANRYFDSCCSSVFAAAAGATSFLRSGR